MKRDLRTQRIQEIKYAYRGGIERGADYHWVDGYSETSPSGHVFYPWMTRRECQQDAKAKGGKAFFVDERRA